MVRTAAQSKTDDFVYVDLDEPSPWWASVVGAAAAMLIAAVLVAPWAIDWNDDTPEQVASNTLQDSSSLCRPNSAGLPALFDPTVASWSRFCEWFIDPDTDAP